MGACYGVDCLRVVGVLLESEAERLGIFVRKVVIEGIACQLLTSKEPQSPNSCSTHQSAIIEAPTVFSRLQLDGS